MQQRPVRVQSVLRGPTEASCLQQAVADAAQANANGYLPVWQRLGPRDTGRPTLDPEDAGADGCSACCPLPIRGRALARPDTARRCRPQCRARPRLPRQPR